MRLIDADALIESIRELLLEPDSAQYMWSSDVLGKVKDAPTVGGWISVKDRLPEKSGWYLVSLVNTRTGHRWEVPVSADYSHGKWDYAYLGEEDATWMLNNTVTHWMPLPEPPKEDEE